MTRKILLFIAIAMLVLVLADCHRGEDPGNPRDEQMGKLSATWKCTQAVRDAIIQSGYDNFVVTISSIAGASSFSYACSGMPATSPWPSSGTLAFGDNILTNLLRDSKLSVEYSLSSDGNVLELTFLYSSSTGRVKEIDGEWTFTFTKQ